MRDITAGLVLMAVLLHRGGESVVQGRKKDKCKSKVFEHTGGGRT